MDGRTFPSHLNHHKDKAGTTFLKIQCRTVPINKQQPITNALFYSPGEVPRAQEGLQLSVTVQFATHMAPAEATGKVWSSDPVLLNRLWAPRAAPSGLGWRCVHISHVD